MAIFVLEDCNGNNVTIRANEIGELLETVYECDYNEGDNIKDFIEYFLTGCQDDEDEDDYE